MNAKLFAIIIILFTALDAFADFNFSPSVTAGPREDRTAGVPNATEGVNWQQFATNRMAGLASTTSSVGSGRTLALWRTGVNYREIITTRTPSMSKLWLAQVGESSDPSDFGNRTHFGGVITITNGWKIRLSETKFRVRSVIGPIDAPIFGNIDTTATMDTLGYFRVATGLNASGRCDRLDYGGVGVGFTVNDTTATVGAVLRYCFNNNVRFLFTTTVVGEDQNGAAQTRTFESTHWLAIADLFTLEANPPGGAGSIKVNFFDSTLASAGRVMCVESSPDLVNWSRRADVTTLGESVMTFTDALTMNRQFYRASICPVSVAGASPRSAPFVPTADVATN